MIRERFESLPDDDWRRRDPRFQELQLSRHLELVEHLKAVAGRHGRRPAQSGRLR
jgi:aryl-alcohol dehydrogenase-like predicted oxidoreductase